MYFLLQDVNMSWRGTSRICKYINLFMNRARPVQNPEKVYFFPSVEHSLRLYRKIKFRKYIITLRRLPRFLRPAVVYVSNFLLRRFGFYQAVYYDSHGCPRFFCFKNKRPSRTRRTVA